MAFLLFFLFFLFYYLFYFSVRNNISHMQHRIMVILFSLSSFFCNQFFFFVSALFWFSISQNGTVFIREQTTKLSLKSKTFCIVDVYILMSLLTMFTQQRRITLNKLRMPYFKFPIINISTLVPVLKLHHRKIIIIKTRNGGFY